MTDSSLPEIRLSDAERDQVISQLNLAMSDGRLDVGEFEQRSRLVYMAKVPSDLDDVLKGLPVTPSAPPVVATPSSGNNRWFFSLIGDRTQRGDLDMGDKATSISLIGDTTFDLTQVTASSVDLRAFAVIGDVKVLVRPGTRVSANVFVLLGDRVETEAGPLAADGLDVRLRVFALIGDVKVKVVEV